MAYSLLNDDFEAINDLDDRNEIECLIIPSYMTETIYESCTYDKRKPLNFEEN